MISTTNAIGEVLKNENTAVTGKSKSAASAAAADFESFLSLLTAQLRHQDPLSPLDSTQFVAQLASFSSVEQQVQTNRRLEDLTTALNVSGFDGVTQWIGKEVEASSDTFKFSGSPIEFNVPASVDGEPSEIVIRDSSDAIVFRSDLSSSDKVLAWAGVDNMGNAVPNAEYKIAINYSSGGFVIDSKNPAMNSRVTEARLIDGAIRLILSNGAAIDPSAITAVRESVDNAVITPASDPLPGNT